MKVGDYVRTNKGNIAKIVKITDLTIICDYIIYPSNYGFNKQLRKENLKRLGVKSSPNIIDLIEVGDYVNGVMVTEIKDGKPFKEDYNDPYYSYYFDDIYSIVTKEQFEAMKYEIK